MRVLVCGSSGCIGSAVVRGLRWRGHHVVETRRGLRGGDGDTLALDFARPASVTEWASRLLPLDLDAIVNCAGAALPPRPSTLADRVHGDGPVALFRGAARAGVARIVNVSALGTDGGDGARRSGDGWRAKRSADDVLLGLGVVVSYRELLAALRTAQGRAAALPVALPMSLARVAARLKGAPWRGLPDADVLRLLDRVGVAQRNAAPVLLGRAPSTLAEGLLVTPPPRSPPATENTRQRPLGARWLHHLRGVL